MEQPHHRPDAKGHGARLPEGRLPGHRHGRCGGRGRQRDHGPGYGRRPPRPQPGGSSPEGGARHPPGLPAGRPRRARRGARSARDRQRGGDHRPRPPRGHARRPPCRGASKRLRRQGGDRRVHGRQEAGPGVLGRRRDRAQLPRRPRRGEPTAPGPLSGGARLARGRRDPGPGPLAPDQPGLRAAVPACHHGHPWRKALPVDHCQAPRQPRRPDKGRAAQRRQRPFPAGGQSGEPLGAPRPAGLLRRALLRECRRDGLRDLRAHHRPSADRWRRRPQEVRRHAADEHLPQPAPGPAHLRPERPLRGVREDPRLHPRAGRAGGPARPGDGGHRRRRRLHPERGSDPHGRRDGRGDQAPALPGSHQARADLGRWRPGGSEPRLPALLRQRQVRPRGPGDPGAYHDR